MELLGLTFGKELQKDENDFEMRRSTAINNIVNLVLDEVISLDDLEEFSDDLKEAVKYVAEKW